MNVASALLHENISNVSAMAAVQQVRDYVEAEGERNRVQRASKLLHKVFGITETFSQHANEVMGDQSTWALKITQAMVEYAIKHSCEIDNIDFLLTQSHLRASQFINNADNQWMFAYQNEKTFEGRTVETTTVTDKVDVRVAVKADGSVKKGGKGVIAEALYTKFVVEATEPITNMEFVKMLMDELDMSLSGARTYAANCKKKLTK